MNSFQKKRIAGALYCEEQLTILEWNFINSLADKGDDYILTNQQNHRLNKIAEKTKK